jgi:hypothetical protein
MTGAGVSLAFAAASQARASAEAANGAGVAPGDGASLAAGAEVVMARAAGRMNIQYAPPAARIATTATATSGVDPLASAGSGTAVSPGGSSAPQRHAVTLRGTRRPHDGQTRLNPDGSWLALSEVEGSGIGHNRGLNR